MIPCLFCSVCCGRPLDVDEPRLLEHLEGDGLQLHRPHRNHRHRGLATPPPQGLQGKIHTCIPVYTTRMQWLHTAAFREIYIWQNINFKLEMVDDLCPYTLTGNKRRRQFLRRTIIWNKTKMIFSMSFLDIWRKVRCPWRDCPRRWRRCLIIEFAIVLSFLTLFCPQDSHMRKRE